jgi:hypothetical protein
MGLGDTWRANSRKFHAAAACLATSALNRPCRHLGGRFGCRGLLTGFISHDAADLPGIYQAMDIAARFVVLPLLLLSLATGVIQGLGTIWGLFRHYWVTVKLLVTLFVTLVLALQLELIGSLADKAEQVAFLEPGYRNLRFSPLLHAGAGFLILLIPLALSIYKPKGVTRHGWRQLQAGRNR